MVAVGLLAGACGKGRVAPKDTNGDPVALTAIPVTSSPPPLQPLRVEAHGCPIEVTLVPDEPSMIAGAPLWLTLRATTTCTKKLGVLDGGDYRNRFGRADSYKLTATRDNGSTLAPLDPGPSFGGMSGPRPLEKDKPFEKRLLLSHWFEIAEAGRYTITATKTLLVGEGHTSPDEKDKAQIGVHVATTIEVRKGTTEEMGLVIDVIGLKSLTQGDAADEAVRALGTIHDDRTVPWFVKLASGPRESSRMYGVWGLERYGTDEALAALEKALDGGDKALENAAAQTIAKNPHPRAWDVLWARKDHPNDDVRLTVLHTLARKNDLPDRRKRIEGFTTDRAPIVQQEARRYLRDLGHGK